MITDVEVEDFQAVRRASLKLGRLTVVTGPTGSGKSAVVRAMRLVAFNARGTSFIRHGAKACKAALGSMEENWAAAIHRGKGADKYVLTWREGSEPDGVNGASFTKLEGKVPEEVRGHVCLGEVNFAGQFDRPYLLTDSGSQVARVLGELTNVTLVFDAAREANRRKLETARDLRAAEARLADLTEQARGFRGLKGRAAAVREAEQALAAMQQAGQGEARLRALVSQHEQAANLLAAARSHLERSAPPDGERLEELENSWCRLEELLTLLYSARQDRENACDEAGNWQRQEERLHQLLHQTLVAAGTCPTCGQSVTGE